MIHRTEDRVLPVARARELATLLPNARLFEQPGEDHCSYSGDVDGWMDEFERSVTGAVRSRPVGALRRRAVRIVTLGRFAVEVDGDEVPMTAWGSRRVLHGGVIAGRDSVRLDLREVDTDLEALFRATDDAAIVAAYPGPLLPEDVYESWTTGVQLGLRLREVDGFDEDAHRLLLAALRRVGPWPRPSGTTMRSSRRWRNSGSTPRTWRPSGSRWCRL